MAEWLNEGMFNSDPGMNGANPEKNRGRLPLERNSSNMSATAKKIGNLFYLH